MLVLVSSLTQVDLSNILVCIVGLGELKDGVRRDEGYIVKEGEAAIGRAHFGRHDNLVTNTRSQDV